MGTGAGKSRGRAEGRGGAAETDTSAKEVGGGSSGLVGGRG